MSSGPGRAPPSGQGMCVCVDVTEAWLCVVCDKDLGVSENWPKTIESLTTLKISVSSYGP